MSQYRFSERSWRNLQGVHPKLIAVISEAILITPIDFVVIEGLRTIERQKELVAAGKSWTMNSKHLEGKAVDIAAWINGDVSWDFAQYRAIAYSVQEAARRFDVSVQWGGNWPIKKDGPHFQLEG